MERRPRFRSWFPGLALLVFACGQASAPPAGSIDPAELAERIRAGNAPFILDVRTEPEFAAGHLPGAVNVPHDELAERLDELPAARDAEIVVHCQSGRRAGLAEEVLGQAGYTRILDLQGHFADWKQSGRPLE